MQPLISVRYLRRPIEYSHKYVHFFEEPHDLESVVEFIATETWLYDSPVISNFILCLASTLNTPHSYAPREPPPCMIRRFSVLCWLFFCCYYQCHYAVG